MIQRNCNVNLLISMQETCAFCDIWARWKEMAKEVGKLKIIYTHSCLCRSNQNKISRFRPDHNVPDGIRECSQI